MQTKTASEKAYSVREAAEIFAVTPGRIRQILTIEAPLANIAIGEKFGFMWKLSEQDIRKISWFTRQVPARH